MILKTIYDADEKKLSSFSCGNKDLDKYLKKYALTNDQNGYGKTFILEDNDEIVGFFTLCSASIQFEEYPSKLLDKLPKYPIPCIKIAGLAVSKSHQDKGYGKELLKQSFIKVLSVSNTIGIRLVIVDAKETSKVFYEKYGFIKLKDNGLTYFLPVGTIEKAIK